MLQLLTSFLLLFLSAVSTPAPQVAFEPSVEVQVETREEIVLSEQVGTTSLYKDNSDSGAVPDLPGYIGPPVPAHETEYIGSPVPVEGDEVTDHHVGYIGPPVPAHETGYIGPPIPVEEESSAGTPDELTPGGPDSNGSLAPTTIF